MDNVTPLYKLASETKQFLRAQAEGIIRDKVALSDQALEALTPTAVRALVHELQVHQIELEMQNETLRQTQLQLVAMQARYFDLYDLAPISYCTVNELGIILEANLSTAELLGEARGKLVGQRISRYIRKDFQDTYYLSCKLLLSTGVRQCCELHMLRIDDSDFWVKVSMSTAKGSNGDMMQRLVLTDITGAKIMATAMQESESRLRTLLDAIPSPLVLR
jgi:PAS domain S-box-containing protein